MSIRINENIFSLLVNRNLARNSGGLDKAMNRLSSGLKINSASDDPAGMANSHVLRSKIQSFQQTVTNCNQGLNLVNVAESALSTVTDILQRLRELALQTSNDTVNPAQRQLVQEEVKQQLAEIQRIASTSNYNNKNLLDGTFTNLQLQVGTRINENMPISIEDCRTSILGAVARVTGANPVSNAPIAGGGDLVINGVNVPTSQFDGISVIEGDSSGIAKAAAVNLVTKDTGVTATANPTVFDATGASILGGSLDGAANSLSINGVNIGAVDFLAGDSNGALRDRINGFSGQTGVTASRGANGELVLTASDGRNVQLVTTGTMADKLGLAPAAGDVNTVQHGTITLSSPKTITVGGTVALLGLGAGQAVTFVDANTAIANLSLDNVANSQLAIQTIDTAMTQLLSRRSSLGALCNRIQSTIDDVMLNVENLSAADSRIRDADFTVETANLSQSQILQQAGISILSQANVVPKMALDLLTR